MPFSRLAVGTSGVIEWHALRTFAHSICWGAVRVCERWSGDRTAIFLRRRAPAMACSKTSVMVLAYGLADGARWCWRWGVVRREEDGGGDVARRPPPGFFLAPHGGEHGGKV